MGVLAAKQMGAARIIRHYLGAWRARRGADQGIDQRRRRRCCARMRGHAAVDATGDPVGAAGRDDRLCRRASRACRSTVRSCSSRRPGCSGDQRRCAPDRTIGPDRVRTGASAEIWPGRQNVVASDIMSSGRQNVVAATECRFCRQPSALTFDHRKRLVGSGPPKTRSDRT